MPNLEPEMMSLYWRSEDSLQEHRIDKEDILIGRSRSCDLVLELNSISRKHANVFQKEGNYFIKDLGSSYGTRVNDHRLEPMTPRLISPGDSLQIGKLRVKFELTKLRDERIEYTPITPASQIRFSSLRLKEEVGNFKDKIAEEIRKTLPHDEEARVLLKSGFNDHFDHFINYVEGKFREQEVLQEINQQIGRILDIKELLATALRLVCRVLNADRGFILLYDNRTRKLETMVPHRFDPGSEGSVYDFAFSNSIASSCFEERRIIFIEDAMQDVRFQTKESILASSIRSVVTIPLQQEEEVVGVIYLDNLRTPGMFHQHQIDFLKSFSLQTTIALENARLYTQAVTDDLTRLFNRKYVDSRIEEEMLRSKRYARRCCILLMDIDFFKKVNDTYGHRGGDMVLEALANVLRREARGTDIVARYGGEEFLMLLPETDIEGAITFAERLRESIASLEIRKEDAVIRITISIGVSAYTPGFGNNVRTFVEEADKALYQAKKDGRNQVCVAESYPNEES